ncbi:hypothetical protein DFH11DRAFT_1639976 [Phellopilus nigrolimitatus]|nr:hypothetical protein DFH11DRAFT_1639976 [Phellopilus nigrolimitatus]
MPWLLLLTAALMFSPGSESARGGRAENDSEHAEECMRAGRGRGATAYANILSLRLHARIQANRESPPAKHLPCVHSPFPCSCNVPRACYAVRGSRDQLVLERGFRSLRRLIRRALPRDRGREKRTEHQERQAEE